MGTFYHYLRPVVSQRVPTVLVSVDTEARVQFPDKEFGLQEHSWRLGVAIVTRVIRGTVAESRIHRLKRPDDFWGLVDKLLSRHWTVWVYAHNVSYDMTLLGLWNLLDRGWGQLVSYVIDDPPTTMLIRRRGCRLRIVDSLNYWRAPLADIGKALGLEKLPLPDWSADDDEWYCRCERDARILDQAVSGLISFVATERCGGWSATAAGLSWRAYRHGFLPQGLLVHCDKHATLLERRAYCGGRNECRRLGEVQEPVNVIDVNSLYPSVMQANDFPCKLAAVVQSPSTADVVRWLSSYEVIAHVEVTSLVHEYPAFQHGHHVWGIGTFGTVLCGPELRLALARCEIIRVYKAVIYHKENLFGEFVDYFYSRRAAARREGQKAQECFLKVFLCSLYGKFAQRGKRWVSYSPHSFPQRWGEWWECYHADHSFVRCRALAGVVQREEDRGEWVHSFPAIAGCVTSHGRVKMSQASGLAGNREVFYEDTDSLHISDLGFLRLRSCGHISGSRLGAFKLLDRSRNACYHGIRDYQIGERKVIAAIKAGATVVADGVYMQDRFQGIRRLPESGPRDTVTVKDTALVLHRDRYKGRVLPDGWIKPLVIDHVDTEKES